MPDGPGVYLFRDNKSQVIYVGKALRLRDRLRQYFNPGYAQTARVAELRSLAHRVGAHLELMPYVPHQELPALYRGARLLAMPSLAEGFGLPALEAMACGTAVIAGSTSAMPEVVGDAGLLVDPEDTGAIADAILRLLTQDSLRKDLIARGLARATQFSWERTAREGLTVLDEVAAA